MNKLIQRLKELVEEMRKEVRSNGNGLRGLELQRYFLKKKVLINYADKIEKLIEEYDEKCQT